MDKLPVNASPENLHELCQLLREGPISRLELHGETNLSHHSVYYNVEYGESLGFLEVDQTSVQATDRGVEFGYYDGLSDDTHELFTNGVVSFQPYVEIISTLLENEIEKIEVKGHIDTTTVLRHLRVTFDKDGPDMKLSNQTQTFFQTLAAGGYGKYAVSRGEKPTRLKVSGIRGKFKRLLDQSDSHSDVDDRNSDSDTRQHDDRNFDRLEIPRNGLDSALADRCLPKFKQGHYQSALQSAFIVLEERVREAGDFSAETHGADLMVNAFNPGADGPLTLGKTNSEREGTMFLYKGAVQAIRNPLSHRSLENLDRRQAHDILCFINLLLTFVDGDDTSLDNYYEHKQDD